MNIPVDSRLTDEQVEALRAKYYTMWQTFHEGEDGRVFDALTELLALRASATAIQNHKPLFDRIVGDKKATP